LHTDFITQKPLGKNGKKKRRNRGNM